MITCSHSSAHTQHLLQLEPNSALHFIHLVHHLLIISDLHRELAHLDQHVAQQSRNHLHQLITGHKSVKRLGPLLDQLPVLVELLESININAGNAGFFGLVAVDGITNDTHIHSRLRDVGQLDGTLESLIFFRVVVFQPDLEFYSLYEFPLFLGGQHFTDVLSHSILVNFAHVLYYL